MKTLKTMLLAATAVAMLGAVSLPAQTKAQADIPFDFTVQSATLPAGEYTMERASLGSDILVIRNVETRKAITVLASSAASESKQEKNVVVFHRCGDRYFLAEVKTEGVKGHLMPSKLERELTAEGSGQPMAAVIIPALNVR